VVFQLTVPRGRVSQILEEMHNSPTGEHFNVNKIRYRSGFIKRCVSKTWRNDIELARYV